MHELYSAGGGAVALVEAAFPGCAVDGGESSQAAICELVSSQSHAYTDPLDLHRAAAISRPLLSKQVVGNPAALALLEAIVHPLVQLEKAKFLAAAQQTKAALVVLDIPLLYETGAEAQCDAVAVVSAAAAAQRARVLARPGMTPEKLDGILSRQMPDEEKRRRADFVIDTGATVGETRAHVAAVVAALRGRHGKACAALLQSNDNS